MAYVDTFIAPVKEENREEYLKHAQEMWVLMKEFGALKTTELWGDDIPPGEVTSFPFSVKLEAGEQVVVGIVEWASKEARDQGWEKMRTDERMQGPMQFDGKRMIFGGFSQIFTAN